MYPCAPRGLSLAHGSANVVHMSLARFALSLLAALALAGAPVAQTLAVAARSVPDSAAAQGGHAVEHLSAAAVLDHGQHHNACAQHGHCDGKYCTQCVHGLVGLSFPLVSIDFSRPVLTPSAQRLSFSSLISLRERPPRHLSR
jgi:hypothetical protein